MTDTPLNVRLIICDPVGNTPRQTGEATADNVFRFKTNYVDAEIKLYYYEHTLILSDDPLRE